MQLGGHLDDADSQHHPSPSGHWSASASGGRSGGGFHSTMISSAGTRCRRHWLDQAVHERLHPAQKIPAVIVIARGDDHG